MILRTFIVFLCHVLIVQGLQRRWMPILDVSDPTNWSGGDVSCANDRKTYPADFVGSVYIQKNESLQELVLSNNMELIISEGASLTFTNNPVALNAQGGIVAGGDNACTPKGRNIVFNATTPSYFDPSSWSVDFNKTERFSPFLLDLQGFPCGEDEVVFPAEQPYVVDMENQNVRLKTVTIRGKLMTNQDQLNTYWRSDKARYQFTKRNNNSITVSSTAQCPDRYSLDAPIKDVVCRHRKCDTAPSLTDYCRHPVKLTQGQCCSVCGSVLYVNTNETSAPSFDDIFALYLDGRTKERPRRSVTEPVNIAIGPLLGGMYEILLMGNSSEEADTQACELKDRLENQGLAIGAVNVTTSDGTNCIRTPAGTDSPSKGNRPKDEHMLNRIIIGVTVGVATLIILLAIIGFVYYRRRQTGSSKDQFELGNISSQGFENPVYDSPLPFDDNFAIQYDAEHDQVIHQHLQSTLFSPGQDSGVGSVGSPEKKKPLPDTQHPLDDQSASVSEVGSRKSSKKKSKTKTQPATSFVNPNYSAGPTAAAAGPAATAAGDGMVSVPLDSNRETEAQVHQQVEVKTNQVDSMPTSVDDMTGGNNSASAGIDNPLYEGGGAGTTTDGQVTGLETSTKRDKKSGKKKKRKGADAEEGSNSYKRFDNGDDQKDNGFENPLYRQVGAGSDDSVEDPTRLPPVITEE